MPPEEENPWAEYLPELVRVYEAAYNLIYLEGTGTQLKEALDQIPIEDKVPWP